MERTNERPFAPNRARNHNTIFYFSRFQYSFFHLEVIFLILITKFLIFRNLLDRNRNTYKSFKNSNFRTEHISEVIDMCN